MWPSRRQPALAFVAMRASWTAVQAAAAPVMSDLERSAPQSVRLEPCHDVDGPEAWLLDADGGDGTGLSLRDGHAGPLQAVLFMTEQIQGAAFELLWRTWPECPDHPDGHPLDSDEDAGRPVWRCPTNGRVIAEVGSLRANR